jgi:exosortase family protein XrtM
VALEVVRGCDGSGALFLLLAALVAAEGVRWTARAWGALAGALMLYGLNEARLVALYFAAVHRPAWFNSLHEYFIPSLLVMSVGLFYLAWTALAGRAASTDS